MSVYRRKLKKSVLAAAVLICVAAIAVLYLIFFKKGSTTQSSSSSQHAVSSGTSPAKSGSSASSSSNSSNTGSTSSASSSEPSNSDTVAKLMLVNKAHPLSNSFSPDFTTVPISYYYVKDKDNRFDATAAPALEQMLDAGRKAGYNLVILSGYRTYQYQQNNFNKQVSKLIAHGETSSQAKIDAANLVAPAGASEHETGLAADIITGSWYSGNGYELTSSFENTDAFKWLYSHCADYGFILRYRKDKVSITKYQYEPWHYRYVGIKAAKAIMSSGVSLEEYLNQVS